MPATIPYTEHGLPVAGTTAERPTNAQIGFRYFDTTTQQLLIFDGSTWIVESGGMVKCSYDFAVDGAGSGTQPRTITPTRNMLFPVGAVILDGFLSVITPPVGPTNLSIGLSATGDIIADAAISGAPWSTVSKTLIVPDGTIATQVVVASTAKRIGIRGTVAALSAGKFDVYLRWAML